MKKKNLIILLLAIILIAICFVFVFTSTDLLKTNKQIFFATFTTNDKKNEKTQKTWTELLENFQTMSSTTSGDLSFDIIQPGQNEIGLNFSFDGKNSPKDNLHEIKSTLALSPEYNLGLDLKVDGNKLGIKSDFLTDKYITIENENLKALAERFGIDSTQIPDKIEIGDTTTDSLLSEGDLNILSKKYSSLLMNNLSEDWFTKEKNGNQTIITLSMTQPQFNSLVNTFINEIEKDETLLKIIPKDSLLELQDMIEQYALPEELSNESSVFEVKVYKTGQKVNKYSFIFKNEDKIAVLFTIEKNSNQDIMSYYVNSELLFKCIVSTKDTENDTGLIIQLSGYQNNVKSIEFEFGIQLKNIYSSDNNFEMIYKFSLSDSNKSKIEIIMNNTISFTDNVEIEKINENNSIILNDASDEEIQNILLPIYYSLGLM